jgi:ribonuclease HI
MSVKKISWSKAKGYECSSNGDTRFSAFYAIMEDGRTLEQHYQCDVKGYDTGGTNWKLGKGKPPLDTTQKMFPLYLNLWKRWCNIGDNYASLLELKELAISNEFYLRDSFATSPVNQAHALSVILNDLDKVSKSKVSVELYTDGSARPNPGSAGYGFNGTDSLGNSYIGWGPVASRSTNNVAELLAVAYGIIRMRSVVNNLGKIKIFADSEYVIENLKSVPKWIGNDWTTDTGRPVANVEVWKFLDSTIMEARNAGVDISLQWVKAHNGNAGNELADLKANEGRLIALESHIDLHFELTDLHKFEVTKLLKVKTVNKAVAPLNKLLSAKRWFFFTNVPEEIEGIPFYFASVYEDKKEYNNRNLGKRAPDSMYVLLLTDTRITVLDTIRESFNKKFEGETLPIITYLTKIQSAKVWSKLVESIDEYLVYKGSSAITVGGELLGKLHFPPKLACKVPKIITLGYNCIKEYKSGKQGAHYYDITNKVYVTDTKGKLAISPDFTMSTKFLDIPIVIPYTSDDGLITPETSDVIRLTVNIDMPTRNTFSALLKQTKNPVKITLMVTESLERSCRVYVIVEVDSDICIYYNPDSNFRIKK